jgi:iron complex transport system substrate-binding protein
MSTQAMVIGGTSFQSDFIKAAGGVNVFQDVKDAYPIVSLEDVKAKDPDVIILNRDDEAAAIQWFLKQPGWSDLRAARQRRLMSISCDYICHPNTRIDETVEMLAKRFYPDRFKE